MHKKTTIALFVTLLILGCGAMPLNTATPTAIRPTITNTPPAEWLTPPGEVLLLYNPNAINPVAPPATFTTIVANRIFSFTNPTGFKFRDSLISSLMENNEQEIMINLQLLEHKGNIDPISAIMLFSDISNFDLLEDPEQFEIDGYEGWIVSFETDSYYEGADGRVFAVELDENKLFYGTLMAGRNGTGLENGGLEIFEKVINSLQFNIP